MGDMGEYFRQMRSEGKMAKAERAEKARERLESTGLKFRWLALAHTAIIRKRDGAPKNVDYYPSTGKWKDIDTRRMHHGSIEDFIRWLSK